MPQNSNFHDFVLRDLFADEPGITSRKMFGGYGIYHNGTIFAIIADDELYFRATPLTAQWFKKQGGVQFTYTNSQRSKPIAMNYWRATDEVLENQNVLKEWFDKATTSHY